MLLVFVLEAFVPFCAARMYIPVLDLRVPAEQEKQGCQLSKKSKGQRLESNVSARNF